MRVRDRELIPCSTPGASPGRNDRRVRGHDVTLGPGPFRLAEYAGQRLALAVPFAVPGLAMLMLGDAVGSTGLHAYGPGLLAFGTLWCVGAAVPAVCRVVSRRRRRLHLSEHGIGVDPARGRDLLRIAWGDLATVTVIDTGRFGAEPVLRFDLLLGTHPTGLGARRASKRDPRAASEEWHFPIAGFDPEEVRRALRAHVAVGRTGGATTVPRASSWRRGRPSRGGLGSRLRRATEGSGGKPSPPSVPDGTQRGRSRH